MPRVMVRRIMVDFWEIEVVLEVEVVRRVEVELGLVRFERWVRWVRSPGGQVGYGVCHS